MDKKNTSIGVLMLIAAFAILFFGPRSAPPPTAPGGEKADPNAPAKPAVTPAALPAPEVVYRIVVNQLEVTRRYVLSPNTGDATDPYQIRYETTFKNLGEQPMKSMPVALSLGTAAPNNATDQGLQLKTGYSTGSSQ